jgi:hypothetical protein
MKSILSSMLSPSKEKYEKLVLEELGPEFEKVSAHSMAAVHMIVFAKKRLIPIINEVESQYVATGVKNIFGNKGAVNVAFTIGDIRINCVSCHLASG